MKAQAYELLELTELNIFKTYTSPFLKLHLLENMK
jgi:hypothetical protein